MNQSISITITGGFPSYQISFSAEPSSVPYGQTATITYALASKGFKIHGINLQRDPFSSTDELTWAVPNGGQSLTLTDVNRDPKATIFGLEIIFEDSHGNRFSSVDPEVANEGED
jgi:hypothetical protein